MRIVLLLGLFFSAFQSVAMTKPELSTDWIFDQTHGHHGARAIEALLARFTPKSLRRHLLAYDSESLQFASFISPRVIVYNYNADFIMAFNGEPGSLGYHELEILEFDRATSTFYPRLFTFDPTGLQPPHYDAAPTKCARCHQTDIRPNWDPYFLWTGFYGSEDDETFHERSVEFIKLAAFHVKQATQVEKQTGRYRFLTVPHPAKRPNLDFTDRVTCNNAKRIFRIFTSSPLATQLSQTMKQRYPEMPGDPFEKLPANLAKRASRSYETVLAATRAGIQEAITRRLTRHRRLLSDAPAGRTFNIMPGGNDLSFLLGEHANAAAFWRYAFEEILRISFSSLPTSRHPDFDLSVNTEHHLERLLAGIKNGGTTYQSTNENDDYDSYFCAQ